MFLDYATTLRLTGCRPQELHRVEARWFNEQDRQWVFPDSAEITPKLRGRIVPLPGEAFTISKRLAKQNPTGPMFRNSQGNPWTSNAVRCRFRRYSQKAGLPFIAYGFRHTFATDHAIKGTPQLQLQDIMGHRDGKMLSTVYTHQRKAKHAKQIATLDAASEAVKAG